MSRPALDGIGRTAAGIITKRNRNIVAPNPPVDRDPCQRCGVRADVGCEHSKAPLGMVL